MAKSHLKTKTRSSRPNPSRIKASTAPESPKQAAKRTISAQNICKIWVSERERCERYLGQIKRNSCRAYKGDEAGSCRTRGDRPPGPQGPHDTSVTCRMHNIYTHHSNRPRIEESLSNFTCRTVVCGLTSEWPKELRSTHTAKSELEVKNPEKIVRT